VEEDVRTPRLIETLKDEKVTRIACGNDCSFAVTESGHLYSWGMGSLHLGHSMPELELVDVLVPTRVSSAKLANRTFLDVASGSQHLAVIVADEHSNGTSS